MIAYVVIRITGLKNSDDFNLCKMVNGTVCYQFLIIQQVIKESLKRLIWDAMCMRFCCDDGSASSGGDVKFKVPLTFFRQNWDTGRRERRSSNTENDD